MLMDHRIGTSKWPHQVPLLSLEVEGELCSCLDSQKEGYHSNLIVQNQRRGRSLAQAYQLLPMRRNILFRFRVQNGCQTPSTSMALEVCIGFQYCREQCDSWCSKCAYYDLVLFIDTTTLTLYHPQS